MNTHTKIFSTCALTFALGTYGALGVAPALAEEWDEYGYEDEYYDEDEYCDGECDCCEDEDCDCCTELYSIECPNCGDEIFFDESIDTDCLICPNCGKRFSVQITEKNADDEITEISIEEQDGE